MIERLRPGHAAALLALEQENRAYFAASVSDRGDEYFAEFDERLRALLAEQDTGTVHMHVILDWDGAVAGRVNLVDVADGSAELGFRVAERVAGQGLATAAVREVCALAVAEYGLTTLRAAAAVTNLASQAVLRNNGFTPTGDEVDLNGRPSLGYLRHLVTKDDLLTALPMRGLRADYGTKSSSKGGAKAIVDLEPAAVFEILDAVPEEIWLRWDVHEYPDLVHLCFDNIVIGVQEELREHFGPELPAIRVVVHEVLPHPVEANEMNNRYVGRGVVKEAVRRLTEHR